MWRGSPTDLFHSSVFLPGPAGVCIQVPFFSAEKCSGSFLAVTWRLITLYLFQEIIQMLPPDDKADQNTEKMDSDITTGVKGPSC